MYPAALIAITSMTMIQIDRGFQRAIGSQLLVGKERQHDQRRAGKNQAVRHFEFGENGADEAM